ncbi:MAG: type I 3-dehydroquinate dehydratase [Coprobacillaceae bacterium]
MKTISIKNIEIGKGIPKICIPIVGNTMEEIIEQAKTIIQYPIDIVEWRADWFENVFNTEVVIKVLKELASVLNDIPLLFTFRTANEGGEKEIDIVTYNKLNQEVISSGYIDIVDVEMFINDKVVHEIITHAHQHKVSVIASNHDFNKTPNKNEIVQRLCKMQEMGADIAKIAVMPKTKKDVLTLLEATLEMYENHTSIPIVTMSMSEIGVISRITGEVFGSAITFASVNKASAPGQIEVKELISALKIVHNYS